MAQRQDARVTTEVVIAVASFFHFSPLSSIPAITFKVSRQSTCRWSFVYSDKIAAFIACQINLKKRTGEVRQRKKSEKGMGTENKRGKKTTTLSPHPQAWHWPLFFFFIFISFWQIQALAALRCPPPYLLSQQCITCHFRIMSPHVHNDIAFVLKITSGLYPTTPPPTPSHTEAGRKPIYFVRRIICAENKRISLKMSQVHTWV